MNDPAPRRLTRSHDRRLAGVCGGIGEYFAIDPTLVRVAAVLLLLFGPIGGLTFMGYLVLWVVLPESAQAAARPATARDRADTGFIIGLGLLAIGAWLLMGRIGWMGMGWMHGGWSGGWFPGFMGGPLLLITIGVIVVMLSRRQRP